jgi:O-methyltransferase
MSEEGLSGLKREVSGEVLRAGAEESIREAFDGRPNVSCLGHKMNFLARVCLAVRARGVPGDVAECGVYKGGGARLLATVFGDRRLFLYDSFSGFEVDDSSGGIFHRGAFSDSSLDSVKEYLSDRGNCLYFQGWLPDSAKSFRNPLCFIHMDMDHYESTLDSLRLFWPLVVSGGAVVFDDWEDSCCPGVKRAVEEFFPDLGDAVVEGNQLAVFKA